MTVCGICGVVQIGGEPREVLAPDALDRMTDAMTHRGPNDRGTYLAPGVALGVRRLSIVDVEGGHQPFSNEDGSIWAIQNGELYNHLALRAELGASHSYRSRCDTEVLPHAYEDLGRAYPERLRGKFATAVWDGRRRRAVVARDRLGVKPLYYAVAGDLVVFASELKCLLASGLVGGDLDYDALSAYLTLGMVPGPSTPLREVRKLPPGHRLVVDPDGARVEAYWEYPAPAPAAGITFAEAKERLLELLDESVRLRLMSDVPLGAMLSGGLDSSLVVALMARHMSEPVKTFSVGFVEAGESNELADARRVATLFGTDHHELELSFAEQTVELDELAWYLDEPLGDLSALGFLALSELAARHVTVALSGQGADELFAGYSRHRNAALAGAWDRVPRPLRAAGESLALLGPARLRKAARILRSGGTAERLLAMKANLTPELRRDIVRGPLAARGGEAGRLFASLVDGIDPDPLPAALYVDARLGLVDDMLHYFDRASMAYSLEVRVPFLEHELVEFAATVPAGWKLQGRRTKHILKEAAGGLLPADIVDKRKIGFFNPAVEAWFRAQSDRAIADYLLDASPRYAEFLDPGVVRSLVEAHLSGRDTSRSDLLLSILMLEVWLSSTLPRALASAQPQGRPAARPAAR